MRELVWIMSCRAIRVHAVGVAAAAIALMWSPVFSADWHVRPVSDCAVAGDGSSPNCATSSGAAGSFSGFAGVTWSSIQPGDTLYIIGTHVATGLVIQASGAATATATAPITVRGDLSGFAPGVIDGNGVASFCVYDNDGSHDISIVRVSIRGCTSRGLYFRNGLAAVNRSGLQLRDVHVADIAGSSTSSPNCVWAYGEGVTIRNSRIENCADDGIWIVGANATIENNWIERVGTGAGAAGDCIQLSGDASNFSITGNYCNHLAADEKQCFIAYDSASTAAVGRITDNICVLPRPNGSRTKGIFNGYDAVLIARNFVTGGESGIWNIGDAQIVANIVTGFSGVGIYVGGGSHNVALNNTVVGGYRTGKCLLSDSFSSFINNVLTRCERAAAAYTGQYNGANQWIANVSWDNTFNTGEFSVPDNNPVDQLTFADPGFSGNALYDPLAWRSSISTPAYDVSSYGPAALLNFAKELRAFGAQWGAF